MNIVIIGLVHATGVLSDGFAECACVGVTSCSGLGSWDNVVGVGGVSIRKNVFS